MDRKYILDNYLFKKLSVKYDLSKFNCDSDDLNDFIKNDALKQQEEKLNITQLVICCGKIIGFFSLSADTLRLKDIREDKTKKTIKSHIPQSKELPAIKIGRFAISKEYSHQGIGSHIIQHIILNIITLSENELGLRFIIVEAYAKAYKFYKYNNFVNIKKHDNELKKLDIIIQKNPNQIFYLYSDITKILR